MRLCAFFFFTCKSVVYKSVFMHLLMKHSEVQIKISRERVMECAISLRMCTYSILFCL